jgi:bacteriocin-like protein
MTEEKKILNEEQSLSKENASEEELTEDELTNVSGGLTKGGLNTLIGGGLLPPYFK